MSNYSGFGESGEIEFPLGFPDPGSRYGCPSVLEIEPLEDPEAEVPEEQKKEYEKKIEIEIEIVKEEEGKRKAALEKSPFTDEELAKEFYDATGGHFEETVTHYWLPREKVTIPEESLASGNYGIVYKADYEKEGNVIPIVVKKWKSTTAKEVVREMLTNFNICGTGENGLVAKFIGYVYDAPTLNLFMANEFANLGSLEAFLIKAGKIKGSLSQRQLIDILIQCAKALDFVHKKGYVHRDVAFSVSPENEIRIMITDFGLARKFNIRWENETDWVPANGSDATNFRIIEGVNEDDAKGNNSQWPKQDDNQYPGFGPKSDVFLFGWMLVECYYFGDMTKFYKCYQLPFARYTGGKTKQVSPKEVADLYRECKKPLYSDRPGLAEVIQVLESVKDSELPSLYKD